MALSPEREGPAIDTLPFIFNGAAGCEVGVARDKSFLRILLNDKILQYMIFYFPIDLGRRPLAYTIGADNFGKNGMTFELFEYMVYNYTLAIGEFDALSRRARERFKLIY